MRLGGGAGCDSFMKKIILIAFLPFSNKEEGCEQSSAEDDGSESADDAQSSRTHSLSNYQG